MYHRDIARETYWKVLGKYSAFRRKHCDPTYSVLADDYEYEEVEAVAKMIRQVGATEEDFLAAQFEGADADSYPELPELQSYEAAERWRLFVFNRNVDNHVYTQRVYLMNALATWDITPEEAVAIPFIPFTAWFRVLHTEKPPQEWIDEALEEVSNPVLLKAIEVVGYEVPNITRWRKD